MPGMTERGYDWIAIAGYVSIAITAAVLVILLTAWTEPLSAPVIQRA